MDNTQINSFIQTGKSLTPGLYLKETDQGFQTTSVAAEGMSVERINEVAQNCLSSLKKEQDSKRVESLIDSLQNVEKNLKATNCFAKVYKKAKESVFDKLPLVLWDKIAKFDVPKEWAKNESVSTLFKQSLTNTKIWQQEADKLELKGDLSTPQKVKEAVLNYYRELHFVKAFNTFVLDQIEEYWLIRPFPQELRAITNPLKQQQAILNLVKDKTLSRVDTIFQNLIEDFRFRNNKEYIYIYLKLMDHVVLDFGWLQDHILIADIMDPDTKRQLAASTVKNLPPVGMPFSYRIMEHYLRQKKESIDVDLAIQIVDKCTAINSGNSIYALHEWAYERFGDQLDKCKILMSKLIQKGDRSVPSLFRPKIPDEIQKFIQEEIEKADKQ